MPYMPIAGRFRIGAAMLNYCDELTFGVTSDPDVTDLDALVEGIEAGWWSRAGPKVPPPGT